MNSGLPSLRRCIRRASRFGKLVARKLHREKLRHGFLGQVLERQLLTQAVRLQLPLDAFQRVVAEDDVDRPIGADHHQPRRVAAPRQVADEIERRVVAPVQIFEHDDQRRLGGDRLDRLGHLAQHAFAGGARPLPLQRLALGGRQQRRQLDEPGRRVLPQQLDDARAVRRSAEPRQAVEHRQVRLAGAVLFEALAAGDQDARKGDACSSSALTSVVLPIPGSPVTNTTWRSPRSARSSQRPHLGQLGLAAQHADRSGGAARRRRLDAAPAARRRLRQLADETVAAAVRRLDVPRRRPHRRPSASRSCRMLSFRTASVTNVAGQTRVEQLLLGDELTAVLDQVLQHRERLRPQGDGLLALPQPLVRRIEPESGRTSSALSSCITET